MEKDNENTILSDSDVTLHTASMWKYNPVPEAPEAYPEYKTAYERSGKTEITAARVRGKKHKHEGSNCDDWFDHAFIDDWSIAVVSDGAGSKYLSRIGAKISSETAAAFIKTELSKLKQSRSDIINDLSRPFDDPLFISVCSELALIIQRSFSAAFSAVEGAYTIRSEDEGFISPEGKKPDIRDFSATLLAAAVIPVLNGETFVITVQIGDGMIASFNFDAGFDNALRILGNADSGSFAGETEFLTSEQARSPESLASRTRIQRGRISSVMLMSDGVADDYYPNDPELLRLYLDLMLNGIIDIPETEEAVSDNENIPAPISYPWVNNSEISYSLQYAKNIMSSFKMDLGQLWEQRSTGLIKRASLQSFDISNGKSRSERLSVWLDNYVERGSFDDRTLLIIANKFGE